VRLLAMLGPVSHSKDPEAVAVYRVEPFVIAADVYGAAPHVGRGGWTWYTGAAGWMLRVTLESVLGLELGEGNMLRLRPCIPDGWPGFRLRYRLPAGGDIYDIEVRNPEGRAERVVAVAIDERPGRVEQGAACIPLFRDGHVHQVRVTLAGAVRADVAGASAQGPA
jgi:cyclic beta-1,2-glucan synthetase